MEKGMRLWSEPHHDSIVLGGAANSCHGHNIIFLCATINFKRLQLGVCDVNATTIDLLVMCIYFTRLLSPT